MWEQRLGGFVAASLAASHSKIHTGPFFPCPVPGCRAIRSVGKIRFTHRKMFMYYHMADDKRNADFWKRINSKYHVRCGA